MKKLMIAAAIVCAAVVSQGAQFLWMGGDQIYTGYTGGSGDGASGDGYFISAAVLGYDSAVGILESWAAGTTADLSGITSKAYALDTDSYENPVLDDSSFEGATVSGLTAAAGDYYALFITEDADSGDTWAYLTTAVTVDAIETYGSTEVLFEGEDTRSAAGTGWYTVNTPEPTSGLLLLLGMGALALRRKQK